jgi:hypothetical protein
MIEEYKFGLIIINGKRYDYDVEVRWTGEVLKWQRQESHLVDVDDVKRTVEQNPDTIIIGTGESGVVEVTEEAKKFIQEKGIRLIIDRTEEATKTFNIISEESKEEEQNRIIGLFHLTC